MTQPDPTKLQQFIKKASSQTYAAGADEVPNPEKPEFKELVFEEGDFSYRDSYTGYIRSRGMELVRFKDKPVWAAVYGGGMVDGKKDLAHHCFEFLKKAFLARDEDSFRGPKEFTYGDWKYLYNQEGDVTEFSGYEEIHYKGELVFFHRVIGGLIKF